MFVFFVWILHLFLHICFSFSSLNEHLMFGESAWALLGLCCWSIVAGAMSVILCMFVVIHFVFDLA